LDAAPATAHHYQQHQQVMAHHAGCRNAGSIMIGQHAGYVDAPQQQYHRCQQHASGQQQQHPLKRTYHQYSVGGQQSAAYLMDAPQQHGQQRQHAAGAQCQCGGGGCRQRAIAQRRHH
jgi:hypothetical protein